MEVNGEKGPRDVAGEKEQRDVGSVGREGRQREVEENRGLWEVEDREEGQRNEATGELIEGTEGREGGTDRLGSGGRRGRTEKRGN